MTSLIITTYVSSVPGFATMTSGDVINITRTGEMITPTTGYDMTGLTSCIVDISGNAMVLFLAMGSGNTLTVNATGNFAGASTYELLTMASGSTITNLGTITAITTAIASQGGNSIYNSGTVTAGIVGMALNQFANNDSLVNDGMISVRDDYGVRVGSGLANITNSGTIQCAGPVNGGSHTGIYSVGDLVLHNTGDIWGSQFGIRTGSGAVSTFIDNAGTISAQFDAIYTVSSATTFHNTGTINGAVTFGSSIDVLDTRGGTINGAVSLGDGADVFNAFGSRIFGPVYGGSGSDTYYIDDADVTIVEFLDPPSIDLVLARCSVALADNIENLTLVGSGDFRGQGNTGVNTITGNSGDNRLSGLEGADTLRGGLGDDKLIGGISADLAEGGDGDDRVLGNIGNDLLRGDAGDDTLTGGVGKDNLTGGADADSFVFSTQAQSAATQANADVITDFTHGEDVIDLSGIDAIATNALPNDTFTFISGIFTGVAGQVHVIQTGSNTYVEMDVDGNSTADCTIRLNGLITLTAGDFVL